METTKTYYITKEQFESLTSAWAAKKDHSARDHIIYNILRSKPADLGFTERKKNIQANDSWNGFNTALADAKYFTNYSAPTYSNAAANERVLQRIAAFKEQFKTIFGIDTPTDFSSKLEGLKK